jgi:phenylpropionate dioxygenase-like ring-hydroxylating dioxygenase large terminal subunit
MQPEENEFLTRTGPGMRMGELFRRYWIPAMLADDLTGHDCAPVRVTLLGENLVAFRDTDGKIAFIGEQCPHRGASLFLGRNEEHGLRCVYHGWKFDVEGNCVDMPSEPADSNFREKIRATCYPGLELGGLIWIYMGPHSLMPPSPELEWAVVPDNQRYLSRRLQECNYLQALEGGIDSSHVSSLHRDAVLVSEKTKDSVLRGKGRGRELIRADTAPKFDVTETDYGLLITARRNAGDSDYYWRATHWLMPFYTMIPPYGDSPLRGHAWVPVDDEHCWVYSVSWHPIRPLTKDELAEMRTGGGIHTAVIPGANLPKQTKANDYLIDRELQRSGLSSTGIRGIGVQDTAVQESMGAIVDRTQEHLGTSDGAIIAARRVLKRAAQGLETNVNPPGLRPETQRVRAISIVLPKAVTFQEGAGEFLLAQPGKFFVSA